VKVSALLAHRLAKPLWGLCLLLPFAWLVYGAATDQLGANPAEHLIRSTGSWALRILCLTLAVTPLRLMLGLPTLARYRRMCGLFVYFYAVLHLVSYSGFDMGLDVQEMAHDIAKRPFILVGILGWLMLTLLAATSFNRAIKALGAKVWQRVHRLVYAIAGLAILHLFWVRAAKHNFFSAQVYAAILFLLLGWRVVHRWMPVLKMRYLAARTLKA
jgi:methionine sulfoxide reductase heme-binding subunit